MIENQKMQNIEINELLNKVQEYFNQEFRLVQIGCATIGKTFEINYSFDKDYKFENLKIIITDPTQEIPSVSGIYWNAFLYENEIHDLYGISIKGMALDYQGTFYKTTIKNPFAKSDISEIKPKNKTEEMQ